MSRYNGFYSNVAVSDVAMHWTDGSMPTRRRIACPAVWMPFYQKKKKKKEKKTENLVEKSRSQLGESSRPPMCYGSMLS